METTIRGLPSEGLYRGPVGIMEKKMEITTFANIFCLRTFGAEVIV